MSSMVILNGKQVAVPKDFFDVGVKASFGENIQANLTTEEFTFVLDAYKEILEWINGGRNGGVGIFEGMPISILTSNAQQSLSVFKGILNLQKEHTIQERLGQVTTTLRQDNSLNQLDELLEPLDYGYLESLGVITSSDYVNVDYVIDEIDNTLKTIFAFVTIYLLSKQLADSIKSISETAATVAGLISSSLTGSVGATVYAIASGVLEVAYASSLLVLILNFGIDLFNVLVQPLRTHQAILLKTLLVKACEYIGYTFETSIDDLDYHVYLPSNQNVDEFGAKSIITRIGRIEKGIPNPADPGYTCPELFQIARNLYNARFAIVGNTVQFHTEKAPYWIKQSGYRKPGAIRDRSQEAYRHNTDEVRASILISFSTDLIDEYTIANYRGTTYQVLTDAKTVRVPQNKTIRNLDRVNIPLALGDRKEKLNAFETTLSGLAGLFDTVAGIFGGNPEFAKKIKNKVGVLRVSANNHSVPKLLYMRDGRIPSNHRDLLSAKVLWEKYHDEKSFVQNNYRRQRRYVEGEVIPFGLNDFVKLLDNSYFRDEDGQVGKITEMEWNMSRDFATISYWVQDIYTTNLKETFIEPS